MGKRIRKDIGMRIILSAAAFSISLIFLGAGANSVSEERSDRKILRKVEIKQWNKILTDMSAEIPAEHRSEWCRMMSEDPERLLKITALYRRN